MITVMARLKAKPGKENMLAEEIAKLTKVVKDEESGCIMYISHVSTENPTEFIFFEKYTDQNALDIHLETPHFKALAQKFDDLLDAPPVLEKLKELP